MQESGLEMDIRKWLAEIEIPVLSEQSGLERFLLPRRLDTVPEARRARKRSSSDSSMLKATFPQPRSKGISVDKRDRYSSPSVVEGNHSDISHSGSSKSTICSAVSQRYARKPRRKTRADKYVVGVRRAKAHDEDQRSSRKRASRKSKRKSQRKKDEKTHTGIGQEFEARNVSKHRLTVSMLHTKVG